MKIWTMNMKKTDNVDTTVMASVEILAQIDVVAPDIVLHLPSQQFRYATIKISYVALRDEVRFFCQG